MNYKKLKCGTRAHCRSCRTDPEWRERVTGVRDFSCPFGIEFTSDEDLKTKQKIKELENFSLKNLSNMILARECEFCHDFDADKYCIIISDVSIFNSCFNLDFNVNGFKSIKLELNNQINGKYILNQSKYSCLWSAKIENAIRKYSFYENDCNTDNSIFSMIDINIFLEKIDNEIWHLLISADGGYDLFSGVVNVEKGKCLGLTEFLNDFNQSNILSPFSSTLKEEKIKDTMGTILGFGGFAIIKCGEYV